MVDVKENLGGKIDDAADKASRWTQETWDKSRAAAKGSEGSQAGERRGSREGQGPGRGGGRQ